MSRDAPQLAPPAFRDDGAHVAPLLRVMKANGLDPLRLAALSAPPAYDPPRVLVAEDDDEMLRMVVDALRKDGYDVTGVSDGGRLVVALGRAWLGGGEVTTDLVVADGRMPVCTGLQVLRELRSAHCFVPFILMTAFGEETMRENVSLLGAVLFGKPFDLEDLRTAVGLLLRRPG